MVTKPEKIEPTITVKFRSIKKSLNNREKNI